MRYGVVSDVHGNLEALEAVLAAMDAERVDRLLSAGDAVGYGADPDPCLDRLEARGALSVCGNHERAVTGGLPLEWFSEWAQAAVRWTAERLTAAHKAFLSELPLTRTDGRVTLAHASLARPEAFPYVFDSRDAADSLRLQATPVAFIGHTHVPAFFLERAGSVQTLPGVGPHRPEPGTRLLVNVGSVGQPRDGDPRAAYAVYDSDAGTAAVRRVPYDVARARRKILEAGLPSFLAERLTVGT